MHRKSLLHLPCLNILFGFSKQLRGKESGQLVLVAVVQRPLFFCFNPSTFLTSLGTHKTFLESKTGNANVKTIIRLPVDGAGLIRDSARARERVGQKCKAVSGDTMWGLSFNEKQNKTKKARGERERERENMAGQRGGRVFANHRRIYATECTAL